MSRPDRLVVVTGTGTGVGKTWATIQVALRLASDGLRVAIRKPAQSFAPTDTTTDAELLGAALGVPGDLVCPPHRWYPLPLAPPMAADALGREQIAIDDLVDELVWAPGTDVGLVEGAGGLCSPIAHDGDTLGLIHRLTPELVVLVAESTLGVVSQVRLAARSLAGSPLLVVLNHFHDGDDMHRRSRDWLSTVDALSVTTAHELTGTVAAALVRPAGPPVA